MLKVDALREVAKLTTVDDLFVTSVGPIIDDWWNLRPGKVDNTISLSALGSVTPLAMGMALAMPHRRIVALDSDGSLLMNMGALALVGAYGPANLTVFVCDNHMYESVGSVPTLTAGPLSLAAVGKSAGIPFAEEAQDCAQVAQSLGRALSSDGPSLVVASLEPGIHTWAPADRRDTDGTEDKFRFIRYVEKLEGKVIHNAVPPHV